MKTHKLLAFAMALILLMTVSSATISAVAETFGDYTYSVLSDDNTAFITGYSGNDVNLVIPSSLNGVNVTEISCDSNNTVTSYPFRNKPQFESVTVPETIDSITDFSFKDCVNLNSITLPDKIIHIGERAFENTEYYNNANNWENGALYIGKHLIRVLPEISGAFAIEDGTVNIADGAFTNCSGITEIEIPSSVKEIPDSCFSNLTNLSKVTLQDGISRIGMYAFFQCNSLTEIVIPKSIKEIGDNAFRDCDSLNKISLNTDAVIDSSVFENTGYWNNESNWEGDGLYLGDLLLSARMSEDGPYLNTVIKEGTKRLATDVTNTGDIAAAIYDISISIPKSVERLVSGTFLLNHDSGCQTIEITIYNRNIVIEDYALYNEYGEYLDIMTVVCYRNSTADEFAQKNNIKVRYLDNPTANDQNTVNGQTNVKDNASSSTAEKSPVTGDNGNRPVLILLTFVAAMTLTGYAYYKSEQAK